MASKTSAVTVININAKGERFDPHGYIIPRAGNDHIYRALDALRSGPSNNRGGNPNV